MLQGTKIFQIDNIKKQNYCPFGLVPGGPSWQLGDREPHHHRQVAGPASRLPARRHRLRVGQEVRVKECRISSKLELPTAQKISSDTYPPAVQKCGYSRRDGVPWPQRHQPPGGCGGARTPPE
jgi:hypothetical protein